MYNGEDIASLASHLTLGRLDAVWGSRRLSVRDIEESYRLKYQHERAARRDQLRRQPRCSACCISRCTAATSPTRCRRRARFAPRTRSRCRARSTDKLANQHLLSVLLRRRRGDARDAGAVLRDLARARSRRTSIVDGLLARRRRVRRPVRPRWRRGRLPSAPEAVAGRASPAAVRVTGSLIVIRPPGRGSRLGAAMPKLLVRGGWPSDARAPARSAIGTLAGPIVIVVVARRRVEALRRACAADRGVDARRAGTADRHARRDPARRAATSSAGSAGRVADHLVRSDRASPPHTHRGRDRRRRGAAGAAAGACRPAARPIRTSISVATPTAGSSRVLHRREGDAMPDDGETDAGLFDLSLRRLSAMAA